MGDKQEACSNWLVIARVGPTTFVSYPHKPIQVKAFALI